MKRAFYFICFAIILGMVLTVSAGCGCGGGDPEDFERVTTDPVDCEGCKK